MMYELSEDPEGYKAFGCGTSEQQVACMALPLAARVALLSTRTAFNRAEFEHYWDSFSGAADVQN